MKFYKLIESLPDHPPVTVPCYAADYAGTNGDSYVLLLDLSDSHQTPMTKDAQISLDNTSLSDDKVASVIDALAQLHAYWWNHSYLKTDTFEIGYWWRSAERFEKYMHKRQTAWSRLLTQESAWFPEDLRILYTHLFDSLRSHWQHCLVPRFNIQYNLTLVHGDAYFANFLCPKSSSGGLTYIVGWQSPTFDLGAYDLVNLLTTFWTTQYRQEDQREKNWLAYYHKVLRSYGVRISPGKNSLSFIEPGSFSGFSCRYRTVPTEQEKLTGGPRCNV